MLRCSDPIPISMISRMAGCYAHSSGLFNVWGSRGAAPCSRVVKVNAAETLPSGSGVRTRSSSNCSYDVASAVRQRWRKLSGQMKLRLARIAVVVVNDGGVTNCVALLLRCWANHSRPAPFRTNLLQTSTPKSLSVSIPSQASPLLPKQSNQIQHHCAPLFSGEYS